MPPKPPKPKPAKPKPKGHVWRRRGWRGPVYYAADPGISSIGPPETWQFFDTWTRAAHGAPWRRNWFKGPLLMTEAEASGEHRANSNPLGDLSRGTAARWFTAYRAGSGWEWRLRSEGRYGYASGGAGYG